MNQICHIRLLRNICGFVVLSLSIITIHSFVKRLSMQSMHVHFGFGGPQFGPGELGFNRGGQLKKKKKEIACWPMADFLFASYALHLTIKTIEL